MWVVSVSCAYLLSDPHHRQVGGDRGQVHGGQGEGRPEYVKKTGSVSFSQCGVRGVLYLCWYERTLDTKQKCENIQHRICAK